MFKNFLVLVFCACISFISSPLNADGTYPKQGEHSSTIDVWDTKTMDQGQALIHNDGRAKATLRFLAMSCEAFSTKNLGVYPSSLKDLTNATPPYVEGNYCSSEPVSGFKYSCEFRKDGYTFVAIPVQVGATGTTTYTVTTGGVLTP